MSAIDTTPGSIEGCAPAAGASARVLVVFEEGSAGRATLQAALELAAGSGAQLSVVTLSWQAEHMHCCRCVGPTNAFNHAVREKAADELREARALVAMGGASASFATLPGTPDPALGAFIAEHDFELVLVPRQRLARGGGRLARELRQMTAGEVRSVGAR